LASSTSTKTPTGPSRDTEPEAFDAFNAAVVYGLAPEDPTMPISASTLTAPSSTRQGW
jgi:hypothetical protein